MNEKHALVLVEPGALTIVEPIADSATVKAAYQKFQQLKTDLLEPSDLQGVPGGKTFVKKSGWRKIATAFSISDSVVSETRRLLPSESLDHTPVILYEVTARAIAPNGRYSDAMGSCASNEKRFGRSPSGHLEHDLRATAHTRAKNRAIADLVGGGEVSAEEIDDSPRAVRPPLEESFWRTVRSKGMPVNLDSQRHLNRLVELIERGLKADRAQEEPDPSQAGPREDPFVDVEAVEVRE